MPLSQLCLRVLALHLCLLITISRASQKKPHVKLERDLQSSEYTQILKVNGTEIHKIEGVGPQMEILDVALLSCKLHPNLYRVQVMVGSAGTKNFSYVERTYIFDWQFKKPKAAKLHFEYLSRIKREQGVDQLLDIRREEVWDAKSCTLQLKSFDEDPETRYFWKKDRFEKTTKEVDLDLEETQNQ